MKIDLEDKNLKGSLLGLVIALVEIIREVLEHQGMRRMEGESLNEEQVERLGSALLKLKGTINDLKEEQGVCDAVRSVRKQLDQLVDGSVFSRDQMQKPNGRRKTV